MLKNILLISILFFANNIFAQGKFSGGDGVGYASAELNNQALPIELLQFKGQLKGSAILLLWSTVSEKDAKEFSIERSNNAQDFSTLDFVIAEGNSSSINKYEWIDDRPFQGVNYYRLKMIDFGDKYEYSPIVSINWMEKNQSVGQFYPNPSFTHETYLDYVAIQKGDLNISIYDLTGKIILQQKKSVKKGYNNLTFDFSSLREGGYLVKINTSQNRFFRKIIIAK